MRLAVVIPAAGSSARMQAGMNKVFIEIAGKPILIHTLENIAKCEYVGTVFVVVGAQDVEPTKELLQKYQDTFPEIAWQVLAGGSERQPGDSPTHRRDEGRPQQQRTQGCTVQQAGLANPQFAEERQRRFTRLVDFALVAH